MSGRQSKKQKTDKKQKEDLVYQLVSGKTITCSALMAMALNDVKKIAGKFDNCKAHVAVEHKESLFETENTKVTVCNSLKV